MNDQVASEADELRAATREAHEVMGDLARTMKQAEKLLADIESMIPNLISVQMDEVIGEAVRIGLEHYSGEIKKATEYATDAVYDRFDTILSILLGTDEKSKRKRETTIPEMLQAGQAIGLFKKDVDLSVLNQPLSREVTDS